MGLESPRDQKLKRIHDVYIQLTFPSKYSSKHLALGTLEARFT